MSPSKAAPAARWYLAWRKAGPARTAPDPADFGTAFGMEMSLLEPPAAPPSPPRAHWMGRWGVRRRAVP